MNRSTVLFLGLLTLAGCHSATAESEAPHLPEHVRTPEVDVLTVERAPLSRTVAVSGTAVAADVADLSTVAGAVVTQVLVQPGDQVKKGQALVRYRNERVSMGQVQAEASALAAETQAAHAESELARLAPLKERGTIAPSQVDALEVQAEAARAQAKAARSAARSAAAVAEDLVVRAPFDGTVTSVSAQVGETASGAPAVRVAALDTLELEVQVHESELPQVQSGAVVDVSFPNLGITVEGTVSWVGMEIDRHTRSAEVVATLDNADHKIPSGAFAEAVIHSTVGGDAIVVPESAVGGKNGDRFVWVVRDGEAHKQVVTVKSLGDRRYEVLDGLQSGDVIVGKRVSAVSEGPVAVLGGDR